jgi:hypothetical protein
MATINFDNQDAKDNATLDALALSFGWTATVPDGNGQPIPNPETKAQFARKQTRKWWRDHRLIQAINVVNTTLEANRAAAIAAINGNDLPE